MNGVVVNVDVGSFTVDLQSAILVSERFENEICVVSWKVKDNGTFWRIENETDMGFSLDIVKFF